MTAVASSVRLDAPRGIGVLARREMVRYLRHPLFWLGVLLTAASCLGRPDERMSSLLSVIAPAAGLGLFGLVVMMSLVRSSDRAAASGTVATPERLRTLALACAVAVPFVAGLAWFAWAVWAYRHWPPAPDGAPFGGLGDSWSLAVLFDLGVMPSVGGPLLGLVVARWLPFRGAAAVTVVLLVLATIVMQGIFAPLRTVRLLMPWTYFGGPVGIPGDPERVLVLVGSPFWYGTYLVSLCSLAVLAAASHDPEGPRRRLGVAMAVVVLVAAVLCLLAVTMGVDHTMVNPIPSAP
ncbi:hypothetical protein [Cellulomonas sp. P5_E12]